MANFLQFKLLTPNGVASECEAEMVMLPGAEGELGILYGHMHLISALKPGMLKICSGNKIIDSFIVSGGVAEINPDYCNVMVDCVQHIQNMDHQKLKEKAEILKKDAESLPEESFERKHIKEELEFIDFVLNFEGA